jgi:hypothetical protein
VQWELLIVLILAIGIAISIKEALHKRAHRKKSKDAPSERHDADQKMNKN